MLSIVVPVFNRPLLLKKLLHRISKEYKYIDRVVVIDHGTEDFTIDDNTEIQYILDVIKASSDLWFTGALNVGLRFLKYNNIENSTHILILNDDVVIEDSGFFSRITKMISQSNNSIYGCAAIDTEDIVLYAGHRLSKMRCEYTKEYSGKHVNFLLKQKKDFNTCDVLPTRGLCFPKELLFSDAMFNEKYLPQYGSDYEWTARIKKRGYVLKMMRNVYIRTEIDSSKALLGKRKYKENRIRNFLKDIFNRYNQGNFFDTFHYARLVFPFPYSMYWICINISRRITGFMITNYLSGLFNL